MRIALTVLLSTIGALPLVANAGCPEIAAQYYCRVGAFGTNVSVSQTVRNGTTIFQVDNGGEIIADGSRHQTPTLHPTLDQYASNYRYKAVCGSDTVSFKGVADLARGGEGDVKGTLTKLGTGLKMAFRLVTPDGVNDFELDCTQ